MNTRNEIKIVLTVMTVLGLAAPVFAKTAELNPNKSVIKWSGSKVGGNTHVGRVSLKRGSVAYDERGPVSAEIVVDMTTIVNDDLKGKWNAKLVGHLKSDDFFGVDTHTESKLVIKQFRKTANNHYDLSGDLTIKGTTKPVTLKALTSGAKGIEELTAHLEFDRTAFGIRYGSGKFFDNLGDKMISDKVAITATFDLTTTTTTTAGGDVTMNEEIQNLIETYQRGLNEANVDLVRSVYAEDAVFIGQPFPTATGVDAIVALYADFLSQLDFNVEFDVLDIELSGELGYIRTRSHGTIVPKGQEPEGGEGNREIFVVKKIDGKWKFYRYIFNADV